MPRRKASLFEEAEKQLAAEQLASKQPSEQPQASITTTTAGRAVNSPSRALQLPQNASGLSGSIPDSASLVYSDIFNPDSSPIPAISESEATSRLEKSRGQFRALQVAIQNSLNVIECGKLAINRAKIYTLQIEESLELEKANLASAKLDNAVAATDNERSKIGIIQAQGATIQGQVQEAQIKSQIQQQKNKNIGLELSYHQAAEPITTQLWEAKLEELKQKISEAQKI